MGVKFLGDLLDLGTGNAEILAQPKPERNKSGGNL